MARHTDLGKRGEDLAAHHLVQRGYTILHRNWRAAPYEIDIIACRNNVLHFVEVKLRSSKTFGLPEVHVTPKKFRHLTLAADAFLEQNRQYRHIQFDILSINVCREETEFFLIEDVYL